MSNYKGTTISGWVYICFSPYDRTKNDGFFSTVISSDGGNDIPFNNGIDGKEYKLNFPDYYRYFIKNGYILIENNRLIVDKVTDNYI